MERTNLFIMQAKEGRTLAYSPETIVKELANLRNFIIDVAAQLDDKADVSARELAFALMPLDYLLNDVEYRTVKSRVEGIV